MACFQSYGHFRGQFFYNMYIEPDTVYGSRSSDHTDKTCLLVGLVFCSSLRVVMFGFGG